MPEFQLTPAQRTAVRQLYFPGYLVMGIAALFTAVTLAGRTSTHLSSVAQFADNVMFNSLCLGIVLCYATLPRRLVEARGVAILALLAEGVRWFCHPSWWDAGMRMQGFGYGAGVVAFGGLVVRRVRTPRGSDEGLWTSGMLFLSLAMFLFPNISTWLHQLVIQATPEIYDAWGYTVDGAFGCQPSAVVTQFVHAHPLLHTFVFLTYNELPLFMIASVLLSLRWPEACYGRLMLHMITLGLVGMICYWVFPMKGEDLVLGEVFPDGPLPALPLATIPDHTDATRNSFPSLHLGWMLACYFGVRRVHPWVQRLGIILVGLMLLATLNVAHYAIDLVGSFPYVVAFFGLINADLGGVLREGRDSSLAVGEEPGEARQRLQAWRAARRAAALGGGLLFVVYTTLLMQTPAYLGGHLGVLLVLWAVVVSGSLFLEQRMAQHLRPAEMARRETTRLAA